jgi:hypothetical protein
LECLPPILACMSASNGSQQLYVATSWSACCPTASAPVLENNCNYSISTNWTRRRPTPRVAT